MKDNILLYYPPYAGSPLGPPLSLLSLASPLLAAGFRITVIDSAIVPDPEKAIAREIGDALCFGVSLLTGPMILNALRAAEFVRGLRPDLPIIFGGWHPSLLPAQTLESSLCDVVVRGQGQFTLLEIAERLRDKKNLEDVAGCCATLRGEKVDNPSRPVAKVDDLPPAAFHLADFDAYERVCGVRKLPYASSVGCPYACNYCTDMVFYKRRFNAYKADRVVDEITGLVGRYRLDEVAFLDSNFPVDVQRALAIAQGFAESKVKFRWTFQASTDLLCRMTDEEVQLLGAAGVSHMGFGTESASEDILMKMNKKHQCIDDMFETARKAEKAGIRVTFNLILGYPGETERDRIQTFQIMSEISRRHLNVRFSPNIFTPYPGIPIWSELRELGVREPQNLEEWSTVALGSNHLPWLQGDDLKRLKRMLEYFLLHNQIQKGGSWFRSGLRRALDAPLQWRLRKSLYAFPWELWVARTTERLVARRSLLTGQPLAQGIHEVC